MRVYTDLGLGKIEEDFAAVGLGGHNTDHTPLSIDPDEAAGANTPDSDLFNELRALGEGLAEQHITQAKYAEEKARLIARFSSVRHWANDELSGSEDAMHRPAIKDSMALPALTALWRDHVDEDEIEITWQYVIDNANSDPYTAEMILCKKYAAKAASIDTLANFFNRVANRQSIIPTQYQRQHKLLSDFYAVHDKIKTAEAITAILDRRRGGEPALSLSVFNGMCEKLQEKYGVDPRSGLQQNDSTYRAEPEDGQPFVLDFAPGPIGANACIACGTSQSTDREDYTQRLKLLGSRATPVCSTQSPRAWRVTLSVRGPPVLNT
jgi:hypothetical protein